MNPTPVLRRAALALVFAGLAALPLAGQNILVTDYNGKFFAVRKARVNQPYIMVDGKITVADGRHYALRKTEEFRPEFVSVRNLNVETRYLEVEASEINHDFLFNAALESPYFLEDVFIVLDLDTEVAGKVLFLQEVGNLEPRQPRTISIRVPIIGKLGEGHYQFHLFAGGLEVLHSQMPPLMRDAVVDRMTAKRIAGVQDAMPTIFIGPGPEYPRSLLKARTRGRVVISIRLGANGRVYDPKVTEATDPAFGESALTAVRLWRFLPRVRQGRAIETRVDVPFDFTPPEKKT
ncbi:MAG: energy transducer TonB [Lacunisphaera sp.]|nr:energy transducer TonB [Lacunisphaera sp.]